MDLEKSPKMATFPMNVCPGYTTHCVNQYFHALKDKVAISCYISKSSALQEESIERENIMGIFSFSCWGRFFLHLLFFCYDIFSIKLIYRGAAGAGAMDATASLKI